MKERTSTYSWANRVFAFVSVRIFYFATFAEEKLETNGQKVDEFMKPNIYSLL